MRKNQDYLINIKDMCELLNRDRRTLWSWVREGKFPDPVRVNGHTLGWRASVYRSWLESAQ